MRLVNYKFLVEQGIVSNRMTLARSIAQIDFPKPIALGKNRLAWELSEVQRWVANRPRRTPKTWIPPAGAAQKDRSET